MSKGLKILTALMLCLGVISLFIGDKTVKQSDDIAMTFDEFDQVIKMPIAFIGAVDLAEVLMQQQQHYNLIDLQEQNSSYVIPTAERHSIDSMLNLKLPVNQTIFIYSSFETEAIQLYYLLSIRGYFKVKILTGGVQQWNSDILQPNISKIEPERIKFRKELTEFFGGVFSNNNSLSSTDFIVEPIVLEKKVKKHHGC